MQTDSHPSTTLLSYHSPTHNPIRFQLIYFLNTPVFLDISSIFNAVFSLIRMVKVLYGLDFFLVISSLSDINITSNSILYWLLW